MDNDLQDIDDLFRSGIESYNAIPSPEVLRSLIVLLDRQHKDTVIKRQLYYGKAAIIIFLLSISLVLHDFNLSIPLYKTSKTLTNTNIKKFKKDAADNKHISAQVNLLKQNKERKDIVILNKIQNGIYGYKNEKDSNIPANKANKIATLNNNSK